MQLSLFGDTETLTFKTNEGDVLRRCNRCQVELPWTQEYFNSRRKTITNNNEITHWLSSCCKDCDKKANKVLSDLHKKHGHLKPDQCDCCRTSERKLVIDHDHATGLFRGWVCEPCNLGIGRLGDNIEGVEKALAYLRRHYDGQP